MLHVCKKGAGLCLGISWNVSIQSVRFKRINLRRLRPEHFEAQKVKAVLKVLLPRPFDVDFPPHLKCRSALTIYNKTLQKQEINPYEKILAGEIMDSFMKSKLVAFLHENHCVTEEYYDAVKVFKRENMELVDFGKNTVKMAVEGTIYEPIMQLFQTHTRIVFSPELKIDVLFKCVKKLPFYVIMAGIVENKFLSKSQLENLAKIKDITNARSQLVSTINTAPLNFIQNLNQHQRILVSHLDHYVQLQSTPADSTSTGDGDSNK